VFDSWCHALALEDYREHRDGGGTAFLHAAARRNQVTTRLSATVFSDEPEAGR
jgi:predicted 2-oxoglutarate/Fe(II)-dependent dioxygenase YbiX